jgi:hypothetical protein
MYNNNNNPNWAEQQQDMNDEDSYYEIGEAILTERRTLYKRLFGLIADSAIRGKSPRHSCPVVALPSLDYYCYYTCLMYNNIA